MAEDLTGFHSDDMEGSSLDEVFSGLDPVDDFGYNYPSEVHDLLRLVDDEIKGELSYLVGSFTTDARPEVAMTSRAEVIIELGIGELDHGEDWDEKLQIGKIIFTLRQLITRTFEQIGLKDAAGRNVAIDDNGVLIEL